MQAAWTKWKGWKNLGLGKHALGKHVINSYSTEISWLIKIRDVEKLQQDIDNDPIMKD